MTDRVVNDSSKRITSGYGSYKGHVGVDIGWRTDESQNKVFANCKGTVIKVVDGLDKMPLSASSWGNYVLIEHPNGMCSRYCHLRKGTLKVKVGQVVDENIELGVMGDSGSTKGRHLHFEVQTTNDYTTRIDPTEYLTKAIYEKTEEPKENASKNTIKVGDTVVLSKNATTYQHASKGVKIPDTIKNKDYTVQQVDNDCVLLDEIDSWVLASECEVKDITLVTTEYKVNTPNSLWLLDENGKKIRTYPLNTVVTFIENGYHKYGYDYYKIKVNKDSAIGYMAKDFLDRV